MNQNFILLDACAFVQTGGRGVKCPHHLQVNEFRLFATSIGFLNGAASTHLSMNIIPGDAVDILYNPRIVRGTFNYVNRLRMCVIEDNDSRSVAAAKSSSSPSPAKKQDEPKKDDVKDEGKDLEPTLSELIEKISRDIEEMNLDDDNDDRRTKIQEEIHPPFKTQIQRIVANSP